MKTHYLHRLVASLIFATGSLANSIAFSSSAASISAPTTPMTLYDVDAELAKLSTSCMSARDHEQIWGYIIKHTIARSYNRMLLWGALEMIGQTEMRAALDFAPRRAWAPYNSTEPSEGELASAPTIEAYYDLKEPRSNSYSLDSLFFLEQNMTPAIAYLDARFPFIRAHYRRTFAKIRRRNAGLIDRKVIDGMIDEFLAVLNRIGSAIPPMVIDQEGCRE